MSDSAVGGQGWCLVGEFEQPPESLDEQWAIDGLTAALEAIDGLSPDLERVKRAVVVAVKRAGGCRTTAAPMGQPLKVHVLIASAICGRLARPAWGFFVLERTTGEVDGIDAVSDWQEGQPTGHRIELYLYPDAGSA
jgi:hypothetical protein